MNISSGIFGWNSSDHNSTEVEFRFEMIFYIDFFSILLGFPINSYVIWLVVTGKSNGFVAEFFSLNLAVCELLICVECFLSILEYKFQILWNAVQFLDGFAITGSPLFQCLICVERYLAVVHPITFLKYKPLRYRVVCSVFVWVAGFISCGVNIMTLLSSSFTLQLALVFIQFFLFFSIQLFCFLSVLRALRQSGPGERKQEEENYIKRRAFYFVLVTNVTLTILYVPYISLIIPFWLSGYNGIFLVVSYACFTFASLVQPFAFLYRLRKLPFMKPH